MFVLPTIRSAERQWQLPLANHTALALYQLMLERDAAGLRHWAMLDPPLLIWLSQHFGGDGIRDISELAGVAVADLARAWGSEEREPPQSASWHGRWPRLAEQSLAVASLATWKAKQRADRGDAISLERAYWIAALADAADWLRTCGPAVKQAELKRALTGFGSRVCEEISAARTGRKLSPECECVSEARRAYRKNGLAAIEAEGVTGDALGDVTEIVELWKAEGAGGDEATRGPMGATWGAGSEVPGRTLWRLTGEIRRLRDLQDNFERELQSAKLAAMAELAYGAGHEINNPLANISSRAQTLLRDETQPDRRRQLATIEAQAFRAYEMIADMMFFAKPPEPEPQDVMAASLFAELQDGIGRIAEEQGTKIVWEIEQPDMSCRVDVAQLQTAVRAVVQNSLEALGDGGRITVTVSRDADVLSIETRDTGPGLSPRARQHLFDPFFSGREAGRGLGLGLSKVWAIMQGHGGEANVSEPAGGGLIIELRFPQAALAGAEVAR